MRRVAFGTHHLPHNLCQFPFSTVKALFSLTCETREIKMTSEYSYDPGEVENGCTLRRERDLSPTSDRITLCRATHGFRQDGLLER